MDYEKNIFSKYSGKGNLLDSNFIHYYFGSKILKKLKPGSKVLDYGCGAGELTSLCKKRFPNLVFYGVDISKKAIVQAKSNNRKINFRVLDEKTLPFENNYFDAIICCEVIEHVKTPKKVLLDIAKMLKTSGFFYLTTPLEAEKNTLVGFFYGSRNIKLKEGSSGHIQLFTKRKLLNLVKKNYETLWIGYDRIFMAQVVDFVYSLYLYKKNKKVLEFSQNTNWYKSVLMKTINIYTNIETLLFNKIIPGLGIQMVLKKQHPRCSVS